MYVALGLVMSFLLFWILADVYAKSPFSNHKNDNSDELFAMGNLVDVLIDQAKPNKTEALTIINSHDLFLFFSQGNEPIILKYKGTATENNGDFIFLRPELPPCAGRSCICYASNSKLWAEQEEEPFIRKSGLFASLTDSVYIYSDPLVKCIETSEDIIFANSRGLDKEFIEAKSELLPLEIPTALQSDAQTLIDHLFETDSGKEIRANNQEIKRRLFLKTNYQWEGGVVIGGMGKAVTDEDKEKHVLRVPPFNLYMQKEKDTNIIGVCLQEKCLYTNGLKKAKEKNEEIETTNKVVKKFEVLKNQITPYYNCLDTNPETKECLTELQQHFALVFIDLNEKSEFNLFVEKYSENEIKIILRKNDVDIRALYMKTSMFTISGSEQKELIITGQKEGKIIINGNQYKFSLERENEKINIDLIA